MKISAAKWAGGNLILTTSDPDAIRFAIEFEGAGEYTLAPTKKKRSNDANAYAWVLIDKLATATGIKKTEIYRNAVREIGGNCDIVRVATKAAQKLKRGWERNGLGWQVDFIDSTTPNYKNAVLYYGSSVYDSAQMSRLIDSLVQDCKALNIETLAPQKLSLLLERWADNDGQDERL